MYALFDLDNTLVKGNLCLEYYLYLVRKRHLSWLSLPKCVINYLRHRFFSMSVEQLHRVVFDQFILGREASLFTNDVNAFLDEALIEALYLPVYSKLQEAKHMGNFTAIFTSSPLFLAKEVGKRLGVDAVFASEYRVENGTFVSIDRIVSGKQKAAIAKTLGKHHDRFIYSDSIDDAPFLECGVGVVVNPDKALKGLSLEKGWQVI